MGITQAITAFLTMISKFAEVKETSIQKQSETTVNKNTKASAKAIKAANKALDVAQKYIDFMGKDDAKVFNKQKRIFDDNIGGK